MTTAIATIETETEYLRQQQVSDALVRASGTTHEGWTSAYRDDAGVWQHVDASQESTLAQCGVTVERVALHNLRAEVTDVLAREEHSDDEDEGRAYWVTATVTIGDRQYRVRVYAAPHSDGRPGLEPCGTSREDWYDESLADAIGSDLAERVCRQVIATVRQ